MQEIFDKNGRRIDLLPGTLKSVGIDDGGMLTVVNFDIIIGSLYLEFTVYY